MDRIIPTKIVVSASGCPGRFLEISGRMRHTSGNNITNLRFQPRITLGGVVIHEGPAGTWMPVGHPVLVQPEGELDIELKIPVTAHTLEFIEASRSGDILLEIQGIVEYSIAHPIPNQGHWLSGETRRMALARIANPGAMAA